MNVVAMVKIFTILVVLKWNTSEWNIKPIGKLFSKMVLVREYLQL